jgi:hypothetical protein
MAASCRIIKGVSRQEHPHSRLAAASSASAEHKVLDCTALANKLKVKQYYYIRRSTLDAGLSTLDARGSTLDTRRTGTGADTFQVVWLLSGILSHEFGHEFKDKRVVAAGSEVVAT